MSCSIRCAVAAALSAALMTLGCCRQQRAEVALTSDTDSLAYVLGLGYGDYLKTLPVDIDLAILFRGIEDKMANTEQLITGENATQVRIALGQQVQEKKMQELANRNAEEAKAFLDKNRERSGVLQTASGLQYEVLTQGNGQKPTAASTVRVHYVGTLLDGTVFDSSRKRGESISFPLGNVIAGWTEGLQLMPLGSTYKFFIPSRLAYGERGSPPDIGPNSVLIFEVELLGIEE